MTSHDQETPREIAVREYRKLQAQMHTLKDEMRVKCETVIEVSCKFKIGEDVFLSPSRADRKRPVPVRVQRRSVTEDSLTPMYRVQKKSRYGYVLLPSWYGEDEIEGAK